MNMNVEQTFLDCYAIAQSREELADLGEDGVSLVGLTLAQLLLEDTDPIDAVWKTRAAERDYRRDGWNQAQEGGFDVFDSLVMGALAGLEEESEERINLRWIARNAIEEAEENADFERAYTIAVALDEWDSWVPESEMPQPVCDIVVRGNDRLAERIVEAYEDLGKVTFVPDEDKNHAIVLTPVWDEGYEGAVAASSTALGYSNEVSEATKQQFVIEDIISEEAERDLPIYLQPEWKFDFGDVLEAADSVAYLAEEAAEYWLAMHDAQVNRKYGLWWVNEGPGKTATRVVRRKAFRRIVELRGIAEASEAQFREIIGEIADTSISLSPSEKAAFCNQVARHAVSAADSSVAGMLYGTVRARLSENLDLDLDDEEVYLKLFPGRDVDGEPLSFTRERQGEALLTFAASIEAKVSPSSPEFKAYYGQAWRQLSAVKALQGRESFIAVKDAVKAELKRDGHYVHSGVKKEWREFFAAKKVRDNQVTPRKLYQSGVTVEMANGQSRFIQWDSFLSGSMRGKSLVVPDEKRESFIEALISIGGAAETVAGMLL